MLADHVVARGTEALAAAIEYEKKVKGVYAQALEKTQDRSGRRILSTLAEEEQGHIDYLRSKLGEWTREKKLTLEDIDVVAPRAAERAKEIQTATEALPDPVVKDELALLEQIREVQ